MDGTVMAELETLYASRRAGCSRYVFAFVSLLLLGGRQTFALDWQEGVELRVPAAFDDKECPTGLWCEIDGSSAPGFVGTSVRNWMRLQPSEVLVALFR